MPATREGCRPSHCGALPHQDDVGVDAASQHQPALLDGLVVVQIAARKGAAVAAGQLPDDPPALQLEGRRRTRTGGLLIRGAPRQLLTREALGDFYPQRRVGKGA
eukprot:CAMPEP_0177393554 /NCGR_PEP_ID=MMETSP0368-20130122/55029_1 /TAXON_ID=447022 ORGANISM="Scrippsiella hangoei-like, Strain SHHI-4" /NCGR_SAMPLE_ID=MMETSP0368 /ASSEMBLY_ACC=CAM_ASM_000363 /LENGTH=104 /DNA_ID=CAMNT_0018859777 /DNA_START=361 /DNA_END=672 /DNA_ORIENTATION=+